MSNAHHTDLAWELADGGFVGREVDVRRIVRAARAGGAPAGLIAALADTEQPEVARLRAFGRVAALLATATTPPVRTTDAA